MGENAGIAVLARVCQAFSRIGRPRRRPSESRRRVHCTLACRCLSATRSVSALVEIMDSTLDIHRLQFAFTITFHYIFPQLTMGLALLLVILKTLALHTGNELYNVAMRFWARIFAINFALGVVTGIPMEFQFGTNWAAFSRSAGGIIGQTLAMEGIFSFFLESSFLGLLLFGERRLGRIGHWVAALLVWLGSWFSGYLIVATDAWMQRPVGYSMGPQGQFVLASIWDLV